MKYSNIFPPPAVRDIGEHAYGMHVVWSLAYMREYIDKRICAWFGFKLRRNSCRTDVNQNHWCSF